VRAYPVLLVTLLLAPILPGCGYQLLGTERADGAAFHIGLSTLANDTLEPGIELMVSRALRRELLRAGGPLEFVEDPSRAEFMLAGRVHSLNTRSRSFSSSVRAIEFSVAMTLELELIARDGASGPPVDPFALREREVYLASLDVEVSRKNREEALRRLAALLAGRVRAELEILAEREVGDEAG